MLVFFIISRTVVLPSSMLALLLYGAYDIIDFLFTLMFLRYNSPSGSSTELCRTFPVNRVSDIEIGRDGIYLIPRHRIRRIFY